MYTPGFTPALTVQSMATGVLQRSVFGLLINDTPVVASSGAEWTTQTLVLHYGVPVTLWLLSSVAVTLAGRVARACLCGCLSLKTKAAALVCLTGLLVLYFVAVGARP